jgi:hypothetical protein
MDEHEVKARNNPSRTERGVAIHDSANADRLGEAERSFVLGASAARRKRARSGAAARKSAASAFATESAKQQRHGADRRTSGAPDVTPQLRRLGPTALRSTSSQSQGLGRSRPQAGPSCVSAARAGRYAWFLQTLEACKSPVETSFGEASWNSERPRIRLWNRRFRASIFRAGTSGVPDHPAAPSSAGVEAGQRILTYSLPLIRLGGNASLPQ